MQKGVTFGVEARSAILTNGAGLRPEYQGADTLVKLAASRSLVVFFPMHVDLKKLVPELRGHYPADTPVAVVVEAGYAAKERVIRGT
ncbi:MAG TPA: tetrapyrrole methylase, partial [Proteobacteria bacterium]|nr:tetrapyrrole methylase [Pseudomonadota bacterium]